jgi:hypothetical protein
VLLRRVNLIKSFWAISRIRCTLYTDVSMSIYPDDDDRDGHRNVGIQHTPNAADSPRRLYQNVTLLHWHFYFIKNGGKGKRREKC